MNNRIKSGLPLTLLLMAFSANTVAGQCSGLACSGSYVLDKQVVASGGGRSANGDYAIEGTTGQPVAGVQSNAGMYGTHGGFWQAFLAPTAASVAVSGRVVTADGSPIYRIRVTISDGGDLLRAALTNQFGYFRLEAIPVGRTYFLVATGKQHIFADDVVTVNDEITDLIITALP